MTQGDVAGIRREYGQCSLCEKEAKASPFEQFEQWFSQVIKSEKMDPTAMVLSTIDEAGYPDSRVVLLKAVQDECFIFYTNYKSAKAKHIHQHPEVALNFYWPEMARQVRVQGQAKRADAAIADAYFASRPHVSQLSAIVSPQSKVIEDRMVLEKALNALLASSLPGSIKRPAHWGGFAVLPQTFEFWQGRDNRLHDRIYYYKDNQQWNRCRLAP